MVFASPAHKFDKFLNNSDALIHFEIWARNIWTLAQNFWNSCQNWLILAYTGTFWETTVFSNKEQFFKVFRSSSASALVVGDFVQHGCHSHFEICARRLDFIAKFPARLLELHCTWTDEHFDDEESLRINPNLSFFLGCFERPISGVWWKGHARLSKLHSKCPEEHLEWKYFLKVLNLVFFFFSPGSGIVLIFGDFFSRLL